jgi:hypothetical protein
MVGSDWGENFGANILARTFWREHFGAKILAPTTCGSRLLKTRKCGSCNMCVCAQCVCYKWWAPVNAIICIFWCFLDLRVEFFLLFYTTKNVPPRYICKTQQWIQMKLGILVYYAIICCNPKVFFCLIVFIIIFPFFVLRRIICFSLYLIAEK